MTENSSNVYEGEPDARQGGADVQPSRFRPVYRALSENEKALHDAIKSKAEELEALFKQVSIKEGKDGRYYKEAMMNLEISVMLIVKELTA